MGENNAGDQNAENQTGVNNQDESQKVNNSGEGAGEANNHEENKSNGGDNANGGDGTGEGQKKTDPQTNPNDDDEEPKTRKRNNIDFILERKNKKIEKLKNNKGGAQAEEDLDDIDEEDAEIIDKRISKFMSPLLQKQMQDEDEKEISDFVQKNPDFAKYADKVRKFSQHPTRKDVPITSLFYEVAGEDLMKIGAERGKKADEKAKDSGSGGGTGGDGNAKSVWDLTPEEFAAEQQRVMRKRRD